MKVLDILRQHEDGRIEVISEFSVQELQNLLQLAVNVTASVGLTAYRDQQVADAVEENNELND